MKNAIKASTLRRLIREELEKNADDSVRGDELENVPLEVRRLFDDSTTFDQMVKAEEMVDQKDNEVHQAVVIAAKAYRYADGDITRVKKLLQKSIQILPKIQKMKAD